MGKPWLIYVLTHAGSGREYVGISNNPGRRWREHLRYAADGGRTALAAAIRKYGAEAFSQEVIACTRTWDDACEAERAIIVQRGTKVPNGLNLTDGGEGAGGLPPEVLERISAANRGRKHRPEAIVRIAAASAARSLSEKGKASISVARKGKPLSEDHRAKLSAAKQGRKRSPRTAEHAARISEGLRAAWARRRSSGANS